MDVGTRICTEYWAALWEVNLLIRHAAILNIFALNYVGLRTNIITVIRCTGSLRAVCDGCCSHIRVNQTFRFGYQS